MSGVSKEQFRDAVHALGRETELWDVRDVTGEN